MTATLVYHHSNGNTIDFDTSDLVTDYDFGGKMTVIKSDKARSVVHDQNRVSRIFSCTALMSRADMDELDGYARPAAAATIDGTYPKIVWTKDSVPTSETVLCTIHALSHGMATNSTDAQYRISIKFKERYY